MTNENIDEINSTKESLKYYKDEGIVVHVVLKNNDYENTGKSGRFYNGKIVELRIGIFVIEDKKIGRIPLSYKDIHMIEKYNSPGDETKSAYQP